jgi:prophage tail gpP-like protein
MRIEGERGSFDLYESVDLNRDIYDVSSVVMQVGDDNAWRALENVVDPGKQFRVYINDRLQMTGRAEINEAPLDAESGAELTLTCKTKMSDAKYCSADPKTRVNNTSIKDFVLALYAPLGYTEADFVFVPGTDIDLMTGKSKGAKTPTDLEPIKADQAKVNPPESIFEAASRHLRRHHLMHWDAADGRIIVGRPATTSAPLYRFVCKRGSESAGNNVLSPRRILDWSEVPSEVWVFGGTSGRDVSKAPFRGVSTDLDLAAVFASTGHFNRPVLIPAEGAKTRDLADAQALRERQARSKRKNAWEVNVDGLTWWDGSSSTPLALGTVAELDVDTVAGRANGRFVVTRISQHLGPDRGAVSILSLVAPENLEF